MNETRGDDAEPAEPEAAVDSEAVELPPPAPAPDPMPSPAPVPLSMPEAPVLPPLATPEAFPPPAMPSPPPPAPGYVAPPIARAPAAGGPAAASSAFPAFDGHAPDPIKQAATERPEIVVGAAFVGGILAAMILRRLGN